MRSAAPRGVIFDLTNGDGGVSGAERGAVIMDWEDPGRLLLMLGSLRWYPLRDMRCFGGQGMTYVGLVRASK